MIIGGGPAGNTAATHAARFGAEVTLIERDVIGGAAHLWDCIPSKTMIATGGAIAFTRRASSRLTRPSTAFCSWMIVGMPADCAASSAGNAGYPPNPTTQLGSKLSNRHSAMPPIWKKATSPSANAGVQPSRP